MREQIQKAETDQTTELPDYLDFRDTGGRVWCATVLSATTTKHFPHPFRANIEAPVDRASREPCYRGSAGRFPTRHSPLR